MEYEIKYGCTAPVLSSRSGGWNNGRAKYFGKLCRIHLWVTGKRFWDIFKWNFLKTEIIQCIIHLFNFPNNIFVLEREPQNKLDILEASRMKSIIFYGENIRVFEYNIRFPHKYHHDYRNLVQLKTNSRFLYELHGRKFQHR